ncbi:hypothetical protein AAGV28_01650 [Flavobacterium sp. FZUC8N2.13]|uniref:Uncharacterized protein n=1 Tax=Flavobacterium zubiriense TaxID=3138075 RepID=A0ABV4T7G8_9FLAO
MKKTYLALIFIFFTSISIGQTNFIKQKAGHVFYFDMPEYMNKTLGLNDVATIQFKNSIKEVYAIVIEDSKEDLSLLEMYYSSINEFHEDFIKDFLVDEEKRFLSKPILNSKDNINFIEFDASYYDKENDIEIYYLIGIVESKSHFYKVLYWTNKDNKDKFKADFQKSLYSFKE